MKKILAFVLITVCTSYGALNLMTWDGSASSDFNDTANWTGTVAAGNTLGTGDSCLINSGSTAATASAAVSIGALIATSGYTGNLSFSDQTLTTVNSCTIDNGGTLNMGNAYTMTGNGTFHLNPTGAATNTACAVTLGDASTDVITLDLDKSGANMKSLTVNGTVTNGGNGEINFSTTTLPLIIGLNASFTNNKRLNWICTQDNATAFSVPATYTLNGSNGYYFYAGLADISINIPAITLGGTAQMYVNPFSTDRDTFNLTGNIVLVGDFAFAAGGGVSGIVWNTNNYNITTSGAFGIGPGNATTITNMGSSTITAGSITTVFTTGSHTYNMSTSQWSVAGNFTWPNNANFTVVPGTSIVTLNGAAAQTITSNGKNFYDLTINNSGTGTIKNADSLSLLGDLTLTNGRDSLAYQVRCVDYTNNTTDSVFQAANTYLSGAFTRGVGTIVKRLSGAMVFTGGGTQPITSNGNVLGVFINKKTGGILELADSLAIGQYLDSSTGTWSQTFGMSCSTAVWAAACSTYRSGSLTVTKDLYYGTGVKENITGPTRFIGGVATTFADSGTRVADVTVAKTAGVAWSTAGVMKTADFTGTSGNITIGAAAGDTAYSQDVVLNNAAVTVNAPWIVSGIFTCSGSTTFVMGAGGYIRKTACVAATLNGNAVRIYYPTISPISYADAPWTDTVGKTATHAITIGGCVLGKDSIVSITELPTGYSYSKTTGLISWAGTGTAQASANYTIRAYGNAKTDSASVTVGIVIAAAPVTGRRRGGGSNDFGFGFNF